MSAEVWEIARAVRTDAGMFAIWQPEHFQDVTNLETWENDVADNTALLRHIAQGALVPINIGSDGAFQFVVRGSVGDVSLSDRERKFLVVSSELYLIISLGKICLGGLEAVGAYSGAPFVPIPLVAGRYAVSIHLIDWKAEPGGMNPAGKPSAEALPDFVVLVSEAPDKGVRYRTRIETFERSKLGAS